MVTTVLLADNEANLLTSLEYLLQRHGFAVIVSRNGDDALGQIAREKPDLVVADVMLSGQSGFEICRQLRAQNSSAGTPIVLLSARARATDHAKAQALGADALIVKPFKISTLLDQINSLLGLTS